MKKSEKLKGKEKVAARKEQYKKAGIVAALIVLVIAVIAITSYSLCRRWWRRLGIP